ncbi:MAG TPA: DUF3857 domain-containing protein, partial [Polyangiaceae bacterium]
MNSTRRPRDVEWSRDEQGAARGRRTTTATPRAAIFLLAVLGLVAVTTIARPSPGVAPAATPAFEVGPAPSWVSAVSPGDGGDTDPRAVANGRLVRLYDREVRVTGSHQTTYQRFVSRIVNEAGLQTASQVNVSFTPSTQKLTLHSVAVHRGGETIDALDRDAVRIVRREANLEAQIYDDEVSAVLFLPDLRVGDEVDYAYSVDGVDPTMGDRYADTVILGAPEPVERLHQRVLIPRARHLDVEPVGPAIDGNRPTIRDVGDETEFTWSLSNVPAFVAETDAPASYAAFPYAELSEFRTWAEVANLGVSLFEVPATDGALLRDWVSKARSASQAPDQFVQQTLRFVQDEVRYVAIEVGMSRRRPTDPSTVLRRRYGDCKDKATLLVALLRLGGVHAWPALVSTHLGRSLDHRLPSPGLFDHAIVKVVLGNQAYWLDPTVTLQGGGLDRGRSSPFERALVLDHATRGLESMSPEPVTEPSLEIRDAFDVALPGSKTETSLLTVRTYRYAVADSMRASLRSLSHDQITKVYLALYQRDFPTAHEAGDLAIDDDRTRNLLHVSARFAIPVFWTHREGPRPFGVDIAARSIGDALSRPSASNRTAPLAISFPVWTSYRAGLLLPFDLTVATDSQTVEDPAFRLRFLEQENAGRLDYQYDLHTLTDSVETGALQDHLAAVDRANALLVRTITYAPPLPEGFNWIMVPVFAAVAAAIAWGGRRAYRYEPKKTRSRRPDPSLAGLKGWLVLLGIGVFLAPFSTLWGARSGATIVFSL